jgi:DNA-binding NarL/FixJ family response regulator
MTRKKKPKNPKSSVLEKLGLTAEEVRHAFGVVDEKPKEPEKKGYLFRPEQKRMSERMKFWDSMVYARFAAGMHPKIIAGCLGVSEETVRVRLRRSGFFENSKSLP